MRKKSKNFRIDCRARATSMVKFQQDRTPKIFLMKTGPLKVPSNTKKKIFVLS